MAMLLAPMWKFFGHTGLSSQSIAESPSMPSLNPKKERCFPEAQAFAARLMAAFEEGEMKKYISLLLALFSSVSFAGGRDLPSCYDFGDLERYYVHNPYENVALYDKSSGYEFLARQNKSDLRFVIRFIGKECASEVGSANGLTRSPSEIITQDYSSGRYFFNQKWVRTIKGKNWQGKVVYSDFSIGDGARTRINLFLICEDNDGFPCMELNVFKPVNIREREIDWLLNMVSGIKLQNDNAQRNLRVRN